MSPIAIVMMIIACVTVFGGVVFAMINLQRHPDEVSGEFGEAEGEILGGKTLQSYNPIKNFGPQPVWLWAEELGVTCAVSHASR